MFATPAAVVSSLLRGLLSVAIIVGAIWLIASWYRSLPQLVSVSETRTSPTKPIDSKSLSPAQREANKWHRRSPAERIAAWRPGFDRESAMLLGGVALTALSIGGRYLNWLLLFGSKSQPVPELEPGIESRIHRPDGSVIHMEVRGPETAPTVILTHGWSMNSDEWAYLQSTWGDQFRVVTWDLPGLGNSTSPANHDFSLEKMARDLNAVIEASGPWPVILVGHSIGGMIILTLSKLFPNLLGSRVSHLVLVHTTYINPLRTMKFSSLYSALQKPLVEPLLYLQIWLSPIVWAMNWLSFWNGSIHRSVARSGFGGNESWSQLDFVARFYPLCSPAVLARGALGMLKYDARDVLRTIRIPVLVVGAEQDPVTTVHASLRIEAETAGTIKVLSRTKHYGLIECNPDFARDTAEFCSRLPAGR
ncbi:MAG: cpo [Planctomycetaceae bacterium]|nr:cpo [Planctomycetaceae bacterium]